MKFKVGDKVVSLGRRVYGEIIKVAPGPIVPYLIKWEKKSSFLDSTTSWASEDQIEFAHNPNDILKNLL